MRRQACVCECSRLRRWNPNRESKTMYELDDPMAPLLLTRSEAATALRISVRTLHDLTKSGQIKAVRVGKASLRYTPQELSKWIRKLDGRDDGDQTND